MTLAKDKDGLTPKQRKFVEAYLDDPLRNATKAYESVYKSRGGAATTSACQTLKLPHVAAFIDKLTARTREAAEKKHKISQDWLTEQYLKIVNFDARRLFDDEGRLKRIVDLDDDTAYVISAVDVSITRLQGRPADEVIEEVTRKVRMLDKIKALESLGRHVGYFNEDQSAAARVFMVGFRRPPTNKPEADD